LISSRRAGIIVLLVAAVAWPWVLPETTHFYGVLSIVYGLVALSVTVLAGWTGQISLGQAAFLGVGTYAGQKLLVHDVPLVLTIPLVALLGALVSLALGIPSLRLRGVYLTIVTLAFGAACEKFFFPLRAIRGAKAGLVPRASLLGFPTDSDRSLYWVGLLVLAGALVLTYNLRRSDAGRALFAIRDSEEAAMALGVRVAPYKIGAFALSSALATTAGVFYGMLFQATPGPSQFGVIQSFFLLALPVIGGLETLGGAVVGGILLATAQPIVNEFHVRLFLASGVLLVFSTLSRTGGVVGAALNIVRSFREQLRPETAQQRYGSFVPDASAPENGKPPHARLRVRGRVAPGALVTLRIRSGR
jgi:branched-chain amino acid transport system permease protein